jgi:hypothetical protein
MWEEWNLGWELHEDNGIVTLRPTLRLVGLYIVGAPLAMVGAIILFTYIQPAGRVMLPFVLIGFPLAIVFNLVWLLWLSRVTFDRFRDEIRRGPRRVGALHELVAFRPRAHPNAALELVFHSPVGGERTWRVGNLSTPSAHRWGPELARALHVAWRGPS